MPMPYFQCFHGCPGRYPITQAIYRCPTCQGLLDIQPGEGTLATQKALGPSHFTSLFDQRLLPSKAKWPMNSGVWNKKEWVLPDWPESSIVSMGEGRTTLLHAKRFGHALGLDQVYIKPCGQSPTGSFKDLGMTVLVSVVQRAIQEGNPIRALACASTGDTSASLAAYGACAGLPVVVLLPKGKISTAQLAQPIASGALVFALDTDFDGCMAIMQQLAAQGIIYLANSMNALRLEGQKTVAFEIAQELDWSAPDWVILPSGNLGNAYAIYRGFAWMKELGVIDKLPRLCAAQAEAANPLYLAWTAHRRDVQPIKARPTQATAIQIGNPVSAPRAIKALEAMDGVVEQASEEELAEVAAHIDHTGFYVCPHTAVALAALEKLAAHQVIKKHDRVVVISTASGLKFTEFKVNYHEQMVPGVQSVRANPLIELPPDIERMMKVLDKKCPPRPI